MWRNLTVEDLETAMNAAELKALRTKLLTEGQEDAIPVVLSQVVAEFREAIRSCSNNRMSPDETTIPDGSIRHAVAIARHRLLTRFSDSKEVGEARLMEYREANRYLLSVAKCELGVERFDEPENEPIRKARPHLNGRRKLFTRDQQDGI